MVGCNQIFFRSLFAPGWYYGYGIAPRILRLSHLWITLVDISRFIGPDGLEGFNEKA